MGSAITDHGHDIVMPTEFLHGMYDGGHGAGLKIMGSHVAESLIRRRFPLGFFRCRCCADR